MAIELATAYVSLVPETTKLEKGLKDAFSGIGKHADAAGAEAGSRLAKTASKALRSGWRPDQDIMAGIPNTKLDRMGANIGKVLGTGIAAGLKANKAGADFANGFADGAKSVGIGRILTDWKAKLSGGGGLAAVGAAAGKTLMAGLTGAATLGVGAVIGGIGTALTKGFDRLLTLDKSKQKLKALGKSTAEVADIVKTVTDTVTGTPFSLDQAFATAVMAIGAGTTDIKRFMTDVADAAGFAGTDIDRMGLIFTQVLAKGKLTGEEMMQLMEAGLPAKSWIMQSYKLTTDQFDKMQEKGEITLDMLQKSIEEHAPGMAQTLGDSLQGSIDKMQTAIARLGADFLAAIFGGDASDATDTMADSVQKITDKLNDLDAWVKNNGPQIQQTFKTIGGAIESAFKAGSDAIEGLISDIKLLATALANIFGAMASVDDFLSKIPGMGDNSQEAAKLREWQQSLLNFGNPNPAGQQGGGPNASRERRGLAPVAMAGESARDFAHRAMMPFWESQGFTVGDHAADQYGEHQNGAIDVMVATLEEGNKVLQQVLQDPNVAGAIFNNQTYRYDGTNTPRPYSAGNTGNPTQDHQDHVHIWYKPGAGAPMGGAAAQPKPAAQPPQSKLDDLFGPAAAPRLYDSGGILPPGYTLVKNATGQDEIVLNPEQQKAIADTGAAAYLQGKGQGSDAHGAAPHMGSGAAPGPAIADAEAATAATGDPNFLENLLRTPGFTPTGGGGEAGTSSLAKLVKMPSQAVGGLIDTGTGLAKMAASAAITAGVAAGSFGGGAAAAPIANAAAGYGIDLAGAQAKVISNFWLGTVPAIAADALVAQMPFTSLFGPPRWAGYDYTQFAPQLGIQQAATTTLEQMGQKAINDWANGQKPQTPGGPINPNPPGTAQANSGASAPVMKSPEPGNGAGPLPGPAPAIPTAPVTPTNQSQQADPLANLFGFDQGGMLQPGQLGINMTNRPEPVLTPQQWDSLQVDAPRGQGAPLVKIDAIYGLSPEDVANQIEQKQRLASMQYGGRPFK